MEQIQEQIRQLADDWTKVYQAIEGNPGAYSPYLPSITPTQLNEVVHIAVYWVERIEAPKGFRAGFQTAKAVAATTLNPLLTTTKSLMQGEYAHFPAFVSGVSQLLSAIHTLVVFSNKREQQTIAAELSGNLSESLALLETAQQELSKKVQTLEAATTATQRAESAAEEAEKALKIASTSVESIQGYLSTAKDRSEECAEILERTERSTTATKELEERNLQLQATLEHQTKELELLTESTKAQNKLIDALLPKGASAGLASAFAERVQQVESTKILWRWIFGVSVLLLVITALLAFGNEPKTIQEVWMAVLHRLPIAAPLIWIGWFSAIQYGNTVRIQEDYAFKEATSKAFAGYRDHMQHMANVQLAEANNAMTLLSVRTIEILAQEPLRIFGDTERDASPSRSLMESASGFLYRPVKKDDD